MKEKFPNLDVTVLYENSKRLNFIKCTTEEMLQLGRSETVAGSFDYSTGKVYYNPDNIFYKDSVIIHEVLGHGTNEIIFKDSNTNKYISYGSSSYVVIEFDDSYQYISIGESIAEGKAQLIQESLTNDKLDTPYNYAVELNRLYAELSGMTTSEFINCNAQELYRKLYNSGIDNPVSYIIDSDNVLYDYYNYNLSEGTLKRIYEELIIDSAVEKVKKNGKDEIDKVVNIMKSTENDVKFTMFTGENSFDRVIVDSYDPNHSSIKVEEELSKYVK